MKRMFCLAFLFGLLFGVYAQTGYYTGDGGRGIRIAVQEPEGKGLGADENWMPALVQGLLNSNFNQYSAMTVIDRQNMDRILAEQKLSASGNYSEENYVKIGNLTNAQYILAGTIIKTAATQYSLQLAVSSAETGERRASFSANTTAERLRNGAGVNEATRELLSQLGVMLTDAGTAALGAGQSNQAVSAETALAKGITAEKNGTVVEALSYYVQAVDYDASLAEAAGRLNVLAADVSSGNIGADARNDIVWRKNWIARLTECEQYYANYMRRLPPLGLVYSTDLQTGKIDYANETMPLSFTLSLLPETSWFHIITKVVNTVQAGLAATGRASDWGLDWPKKSATAEPEPSPSPSRRRPEPSPSPFRGRKGSFTVTAELVNERGLTIGRADTVLAFVWSVSINDGQMRMRPEVDTFKPVTFPAVKADLITDKLIIKITFINGVKADIAAQRMGINILTESEYYLPRAPNNFVSIRGGTFMMGDPDSQSNGTQKQVTVNSFSLGKYEVTQGEYQAVMGNNPSELKGANLPVTDVSWYDAVAYCNALSLKAGLTPAYRITGESGTGDSYRADVSWNQNADGYRLPTEAEWEYACRAGTTTRYNTGRNISQSQARFKSAFPVAVGSFAPNAWGVYDMHGNVNERCWDLANPAGKDILRTVRGGSWNDESRLLYSGWRGYGEPQRRNNRAGFRICRSVS